MTRRRSRRASMPRPSSQSPALGALLMITANDDPYAEYEFAALIGPTGLIVDHHLGLRPLRGADLKPVLRRLGARRELPRELVVLDERGAALLERAGYPGTITQDAECAWAREALDEIVNAARPVPLPAGAELSPVGLAAASYEFVQAAARIYEQEPWLDFDEWTTLELVWDEFAATHTAWQIIGSEGRSFGVVGYRDPSVLADTRSVMRDGRGDADSGIICLFTPHDNVDREQAKAIRDLGFPAAVHVPVGMSFDAAEEVHGLVEDRQESLTLVASLQALGEWLDGLEFEAGRRRALERVTSAIGGAAAVRVLRDAPPAPTSEVRPVSLPMLSDADGQHETAVVSPELVAASVKQAEYVGPGVTVPESGHTVLFVFRTLKAEARAASGRARGANELQIVEGVDGEGMSVLARDGVPICVLDTWRDPQHQRRMAMAVREFGEWGLFACVGGGTGRGSRVLSPRHTVSIQRVRLVWRAL